MSVLKARSAGGVKQRSAGGILVLSGGAIDLLDDLEIILEITKVDLTHDVYVDFVLDSSTTTGVGITKTVLFDDAAYALMRICFMGDKRVGNTKSAIHGNPSAGGSYTLDRTDSYDYGSNGVPPYPISLPDWKEMGWGQIGNFFPVASLVGSSLVSDFSSAANRINFYSQGTAGPGTGSDGDVVSGLSMRKYRGPKPLLFATQFAPITMTALPYQANRSEQWYFGLYGKFTVREKV